jgi:hypothetical protein
LPFGSDAHTLKERPLLPAPWLFFVEQISSFEKALELQRGLSDDRACAAT